MKKILTLLLLCALLYKAGAQTKAGPAEQAMTDTVCKCLTQVDLNQVKNKQDAIDAITTCFAKRTDMLMKVADEMHIDGSDNEAMRGVGTAIGKDLLRENCVAFTKLSVKMVQGDEKQTAVDQNATTGTFKRVELKGFNYIVLTDKGGIERSFIWLRQFPGSEQFMNGTLKFAGKRMKITWQEIEVYLPLAKGYYKVKEITGIEVL